MSTAGRRWSLAALCEFGGTVRAPAPPPSGSPWCADVGGQAVTLYAPRGHEKVRAAIADLASGFLELAGQQKWRGSCPFASRAPRGHSWIDFDNGDEVQMLAAAQWLPYIDARVDRDNMTLVTPATAAEGSILLIMNAFL
ncbi:expressed protein [Chlorella variabilis]|uniref:Expressed protein n=1 Tax=Chlorella variabilis TaxID=554065 RepID=E1ZPK0_CHLVA|nr:expressed protein [Chlorella variabilis]EFN52336.1 expressed protein [Chlorella variabilis]|eukprot:XP_005844438.1 expressed protein [Chlorella variabilis]